MLAFSSISTIELRLYAGNDNIVGYIRDTLDCVTEFNISLVSVVSDSKEITNLVNDLQNSSNGTTNNPLIQILASGNQNTIGQVISSLSQEFNKINNQSVENAVASKKIVSYSIFSMNISLQMVFLLHRLLYHH
jgi:hypothetical protein